MSKSRNFFFNGINREIPMSEFCGYSVPVYYIMGENDYQTPYPIAEEFFGEITAPVKRFFPVPDAGHFTMIDNKAEFTRILLDEIKPELSPAAQDE